MRPVLLRTTLVVAILSSGIAKAGPFIDPSFEDGALSGWITLGDVSLQTAASGDSPTDGSHAVLLTTISGEGVPFSATPALDDVSPFFDTFLGIPLVDRPAFGFGTSVVGQFASLLAGQSVVFDYNFLSTGGDYFVDAPFLYVATLPTTNPGPFQLLTSARGGLLSGKPSLTSFPDPVPSSFDMCAHDPNHAACTTLESGWLTYSWTAPADGTYGVFFGVTEDFDPLVASGALYDNVRVVSAAEPGSGGLLAIVLAIALIALLRRRRLFPFSGTSAARTISRPRIARQPFAKRG